SGLKSLDRWDWSLTTMLEGPYQEGPCIASMPGTQAGIHLLFTLGLIGNLIIKQLKVPPDSLLVFPHLPSPFSALVEDFICSPKDEGPE
ncbi:Polycystic kidney disease protein 1-like 1, partial [Bos mutus]